MLDAPAPARIKRPAMALTVALAFSQDALYGLVFLSYMNHYLLDVLNTSPALPGYTLALYGGVKLAIHPAAGRLLDRHSPRSLFRAAVAVQGAGLVLVLLVHTLWSFLAATCLIAVGSAAIWPLLYETIARTQLTQVHSRVTGIITFAGDIATGVGLAIGVVAGNFGPWRSAFYIALAIAVLPILGQQMSALDRSPPDHSIAPPPVALPDGHGGVRVPHLAVAGFKDRIHGAAYFALVVFIDYAAVSSLGGVYGAYVRRSLDITLLRTAILLIPAAAAAGLALLLASRFSRPERRMLELAVLFVISAAGALGLAAAPTPYVAAGAAVFLAAGAGGAGPIIAAAMIEQSGGPSDRGLVIGTLMSIEGLGAVIGPGVTAAVISASGARASLAFIGAVFVLLVPLSYAAWRSSRITAAPDPAQASV